MRPRPPHAFNRVHTRFLAAAAALVLSLHGLVLPRTLAAADADKPVPPAPASHVLDNADLLDEKRESNLSSYLQRAANNDGVFVYVVTTPTLEKGKFAIQEASTLRTNWIKEPVGAVLVYVADPGKFGVAFTDGARTLDQEGVLNLLQPRYDEKFANKANIAAAIREAVIDLEYEIRQTGLHSSTLDRATQPLKLLGTGLLMVVVLLGAAYVFNELRLQNHFDHSYRVPVRNVDVRLGAQMGGGHLVTMNFGRAEGRRDKK